MPPEVIGSGVVSVADAAVSVPLRTSDEPVAELMFGAVRMGLIASTLEPVPVFGIVVS